jgi:hypothetical protein
MIFDILLNRLVAKPVNPSVSWTPTVPEPLAQFYHRSREFQLSSILAQPTISLASAVMTAAASKDTQS